MNTPQFGFYFEKALRGASQGAISPAEQFFEGSLAESSLVRETGQRSPEADERRARIRGATRAGKGAVKSREQATRRLVDALRRLLAEGLSISESADRVGVSYHEARSLIRAAAVADAVPDPNVGGQV